MVRYATALFGLLIALPPHAIAAGSAPDIGIALSPPDSSVALRAYGLGLLPLNGHFTRFQGRFNDDPGAPAACSVTLQIEVGSLAMGSASVGEMVLGPDFLDAARYPLLSYDGTCGPNGLTGQLTMHGVTRPFTLTLDRHAGAIIAEGRLRRADWGMTARPLLGGSTVRITVSVPLPASQPAQGGR